ncbi:MAG: hypothetical protein V3U76_14565 [Granulosicoccus sp.]
MIDQNKRTSLKIMSTASIAMTASSLLTTAAMSVHAALPAITDKKYIQQGADTTLSFISSPDKKIYGVTISNTSDKSVTLKHVYPGFVTIDNQSFDINSLLVNGHYTIKAGESRVLPIQPMAEFSAERAIPKHLTHKSPITITTNYSHFGEAKSVSTTRSFMA